MAQTLITCSHCGKQEDIETFRRIQSPLVSMMRTEQLCFDCAYWINWMNCREPETLIISGSLYKLTQPLVKVGMRSTRSKKLQFIVNTQSQEASATAGLVLRGMIPIQFSKQLIDEYKFITAEEYRRLIGYNAEMCLSKGCYDRYHCHWYRADIAEPDEPWNTIPSNYVIGGECCPSFINKYGLRNND